MYFPSYQAQTPLSTCFFSEEQDVIKISNEKLTSSNEARFIAVFREFRGENRSAETNEIIRKIIAQKIKNV